jgi:hypothetical protein
MLQNIAQDEPPETETLYDQPLPDRSKSRVAGPYTVEQIPSFGIDPIDAELYQPAALAEDDRSDDIRHRGESDPVRSIGELGGCVGNRHPEGSESHGRRVEGMVDGCTAR